jgi:hypothetical protein
LLAAWHLSNCGEFMSERIDARVNPTITEIAGHETQRQLARLAQRLAAKHSDQLPADAVAYCVWRCAEELMRTGVRSGLVPATEAMARARLGLRQPDRALAR